MNVLFLLSGLILSQPLVTNGFVAEKVDGIDRHKWISNHFSKTSC
jgi:hypothetical protein